MNEPAPYTMGQQAAPAYTTETRIKRQLSLKGGWMRRADLMNRLGNVRSVDLSGALLSLYSRGEIEYRVVHTATKPGEEWRLKA